MKSIFVLLTTFTMCLAMTTTPATLVENFSEEVNTLTVSTLDFSKTFAVTEKTDFLRTRDVHDQSGNIVFTYTDLPRFYHGYDSDGLISVRLENGEYYGFVQLNDTFYQLNRDLDGYNLSSLSLDEISDLLNATMFDQEEGNDTVSFPPVSGELLSVVKYVELGVVSDKDRYISGGNSTTTVIKSTESIVSLVDTIYSSNNMSPPTRVVLTKNVIWTTDVIVPILSASGDGSFDGSDYLAKWYAYIAKSPLGVDSSVLMTGKNFGSTLGIARVGAMCGTASGFWTKAIIGYYTDIYSASIVAHEMGHSFSMHHDGSGNNCSSGFIMWSSTSRSSPKTLFSTCSKEAYSNFFTTVYNPTTSRQCLENVPNPTTTPTSSPTSTPTSSPTSTPTTSPTTTPTSSPTTTPTSSPTTTPTPSPTRAPPRTDGKCGPTVGNPACLTGNCCSKYGWCGPSSAYCSSTNCLYQCA